MNIARGFALILLTAGLGALSSLFWLWPNGLMAAALAASLSAGTLWLGRKQTRTGRPPAKNDVIATGLLTGLVGGGLALLIQWQFPYQRGGREMGFGPPPTPEWALVLGGVLYGLILHTSYFRRFGARQPLATAAGSAALGCGLVRIGIGLAVGIEPVATLFFALLGGVPFALMWVWATRWLDPAWEVAAAGSRAETASSL